MYRCLSEKFWSNDYCPTTARSEFTAGTHAEKQLITIGTAGQNQALGRPDMYAELTRIRKVADIASWENPEHPAIPSVRHVIGAIARRDEELRACAQAEQTPRFS